MIQIDGRLCTGCSACVEACPSGAIAVRDGTAWVAADDCDGCGGCVNACPQDAILLVDVLAPPSPVGQLTVRHPVAALTVAPPLWTSSLWPMVGAALGWAGREIVPRLAWLALDLWDRRTMGGSATRASPAGSQRSSERGWRRRQRQRKQGMR